MVYDLGIIKRQKAMASPIAAVGGVITNIGSSTIHTFTSSGVFQPLMKNGSATPLAVSYLVVAGGASGGRDNSSSGLGGGGGAGGVLTSSSFLVTPGNAYAVTVGAGGTAISASATGVGNNGNNSAILAPTDITYSGLFNGSTSYLLTPSSSQFNLTGDFTIECWIYKNNPAADGCGIFGIGSQDPDSNLVRISSGKLQFWLGGSNSGGPGTGTKTGIITCDTSILNYTWYHVALVRSGSATNNVKLYLNGVLDGQGTGTYQPGSAAFVIARDYPTYSAEYFPGYISNLRVVNGTAMYNGTFTPPSVRLTAVSGTSLLTLQDATFIDNSTNNFTITATGSPTTTSTVVPPNGQTAIGGGGGAAYNTGDARSGGSGGGGDGTRTPGSGTVGQGFAGGAAFWNGTGSSSAGGGGGAGANGTPGAINQGGAGGAGLASSISGVSTYYAGGGGGSSYQSGGWGVGGTGGGGKGGVNNTAVAVSGTTNTGGGGGGGSNSNSASGESGAGGSGVVIISYPNPAYTAPLTKQSDPYFNKTSLLLSNQTLFATSTPIDFLVVAGGGGGGGSDLNGGGGGGAGGYRTGTKLVSAREYTITVGGGGIAGNQNARGGSGVNSSAFSITSTGGGGGGSRYSTSGSTGGNSGGSGGGGQSFNTPGGAGNTPATSPSQGNNGGAASPSTTAGRPGGGGGGASSVGADATGHAGAGGAGTQWLNGSYYAGGGGGSVNSNASPGAIQGAGGIGGGASGGGGPAASGTKNTGGGGGAGWTGANTEGGAGGDGIVIARHVTSAYNVVKSTGNPIISTTGTYTLYAFTSSGSIQYTPGINFNNNKTFVDYSTNELTITATGTPAQGTFSPYGNNWSNYFNGSTDYLTIPTNTAFGYGTGDFTIELHAYFTVISASTPNLIDQRNATTAQVVPTLYLNNGVLSYYVNGVTVWTGATLNANTWYHIAICRDAGLTRIFVNGMQSGSTYTDSNNYIASPIRVFASNDGGTTIYQAGHISNLRIIKGTALYTSNFTPATAPLPMITNTVLLTAASNRFMDKSSTATTFTATGTPSVQRFSPFNNLGAYNSSFVGGSAYFNGSTDYLTVTYSNGLNLSTGNFTIEAWIYLKAGVTSGTIIDKDGISGTRNSSYNLSVSSSKVVLNVGSGNSTSYNQAVTPSTVTVPTNQWTHVAAVKSGTTLTIYQNGVSIASATQTGTIVDDGRSPLIGYQTGQPTSAFWSGYISNLRVVKGTALYTTTFTPPAAPVGTIDATTATSLVLNCDTGGIYDATTQNEIIPIGSAGLSSTVTKFNSRSMYFNGTTDYLTILHNPNLDLSTGSPDFTVECWINLPNISGNKNVFAKGGISGSRNSSYVFIVTNGAFQAIVANAGSANIYNVINGATIFTTNTWYHIAMVRSGSTLTVYVNGVSAGTVTISITMVEDGGTLWIAGFPSASQYSNIYIDDLRITKGVARYTADFTPPTTPPLLR